MPEDLPETFPTDQPLSPAPDEPTPAAVAQGRYVVQESIGEGGMGQVFRAWDQHLGRYVAIKRISETAGVDEAIRREAAILAGLHHPNIVTIFDFASDELGPFVVMEFVQGRTLEDLVDDKPLEVPAFLELVTQVCRGLSSAHAAGLLHLDIKPGNLMLQMHQDGSFTTKILDFGLARAGHEEAVSKGGNVYASPYTVAPEQLAHETVDARTDIYALGCVFYFALSGKNAFEAPSIEDILQRHMQGVVTPLHLVVPKVPQAMSLAINKMMASQAADRPQTVEEARSLLIKGSRAPAPAVAVAPPPVRSSGKRPRGTSGGEWGIYVVSIVLLLAAGGWWLYGPKPGAAVPEPAAVAPEQAAASATPATENAVKPTIDPANVAALAQYKNQAVVVEGTVESVTESGLFHANFVKFTGVPEDGAMVSVREDVMPADQVQALQGKRVRAMGKLSIAAGVKRVVVDTAADLTPAAE